MKQSRITGLLLSGFASALAAPTNNYSGFSYIKTVDLGYAKYQGSYNSSNGVTSYLGVKYAADTSGGFCSLAVHIICIANLRASQETTASGGLSPLSRCPSCSMQTRAGPTVSRHSSLALVMRLTTPHKSTFWILPPMARIVCSSTSTFRRVQIRVASCRYWSTFTEEGKQITGVRKELG